MKEKQNLIIYKTDDGKASVALYARDGSVWLTQNQLADLFATSKLNLSSSAITETDLLFTHGYAFTGMGKTHASRLEDLVFFFTDSNAFFRVNVELPE